MPTLQDYALQLWTANSKAMSQATNNVSVAFKFEATIDTAPAFLVLLDLDEAAQDKNATIKTAQANTARDVLMIAVQENVAHCVHALNACSLWHMAGLATCHSACNVYINMDLLTIDPHVQDWGDFKIKPEQVAIQRDELTHNALFKPRWGFVVQVPKEALTTLMDMLRAANLVTNSTIIGKTWGNAPVGKAVLDIYRDAKKQLNITAQLLSGGQAAQ